MHTDLKIGQNRKWGSALLGLAWLVSAEICQASSVSITLDDFRLTDGPQLTALQKDESVLAALRQNKLQAALFVIGEWAEKPFIKSRLTEWARAGHIIANHTYTHPNYHKTSFADFSAEILKTDALLKGFATFRRLFRFPQLKEGESTLKRDQIRQFLSQHGYQNGYVTIDTSDWYISDRLASRLKNKPEAEVSGYREFYLQHIWQRSLFYDDLAKRALGREVNHTLLLHHNLASSLFLNDLIQMYRKKGWRVSDAAESFFDPVFKQQPNIVPAGESILWAVAKESGKFDSLLRYPAEDGMYEQEKMDTLGL